MPVPKKNKPARAHNEGTVFQRSDGYWVTRIVVGTKPDGKPDKRTVYCKTKPEAVAALKELHKEIDKRKGDKRGGELFASYLMRWLDKSKSTSVRQNTWEDYVSTAKNHIIPALGSTPIADIKTSDIQALYDRLKAQNSSYSLIHKVHTLIGSCLRTALPDGSINRDPTQGTILPKNTTKKKQLFTNEQADEFIDIAMVSKSQFKDLLIVYWEVGGRISELLGLKWSSVGPDGIRIENVRIRVRGGSKDESPKTLASNRPVFLTAACLEIINSQPHNGDYVFSTASGKPYGYANWRKQWNRWLVQAFGAMEEAAISAATSEKSKAEDKVDPAVQTTKKRNEKVPLVKVTPHALRHMQATRLIEAGWTIADVQSRGGWSSPNILMKIYAAHSAEERQKKMAEGAKISNGYKFGYKNKTSSPAEAEKP